MDCERTVITSIVLILDKLNGFNIFASNNHLKLNVLWLILTLNSVHIVEKSLITLQILALIAGRICHRAPHTAQIADKKLMIMN